jgi:hypothetical protein
LHGLATADRRIALAAFGLEVLQLHQGHVGIFGPIWSPAKLPCDPSRDASQAVADQVAPCRLRQALRKGRDMHVELLPDVFPLCTAGFLTAHSSPTTWNVCAKCGRLDRQANTCGRPAFDDCVNMAIEQLSQMKGAYSTTLIASRGCDEFQRE